MKEKKYSHAFDIAFEVKTPNDSDDVTKEELIFALLQRISNLIKDWEPDAFHCFDSYLEEEDD